MPLVVVIGLYAAYRAIEAMIAAFTVFLTGLVTIALIVAGILSFFWLCRYLSDKKYGETKSLQEIAKLESLRELHITHAPEHLHDQINEYYNEKEQAYFDTRPHSRFDAALDKTKQVLSTFRRAA